LDPVAAADVDALSHNRVDRKIGPVGF
jgi:hypothetical protein